MNERSREEQSTTKRAGQNTIPRPGNSQTNRSFHTIDEAYGPVVTNTHHPAYLGATAPTHTDAHLTCLAELLHAYPLALESSNPPV